KSLRWHCPNPMTTVLNRRARVANTCPRDAKSAKDSVFSGRRGRMMAAQVKGAWAMRRFVLLVVAGSAFAAAATLVAQTSHGGARNWTPPKTAWGEPDLQGTWTNETITPFERPKHLADKPFLTKEEATDIERQAARQRDNADSAARPGDVGSYNQFWFDSGTKVVSSRQTSLVVDPPDGRVPLRPEAEKIKEEVDARNSDSFEFMSPWDRCITRGVPGGFFP